jgi:hypothetical protein
MLPRMRRASLPLCRMPRLLAGLGAIALLLVSATATPAAADPSGNLPIGLPDLTVAADGPGKSADVLVAPIGHDLSLADFEFVVDLAGVAGVADVTMTPDWRCAATGSRFACHLEDWRSPSSGRWTPLARLTAKPAAGAQVGASGTVVIRYPSGSPISTSRITIGPSVDLDAGPATVRRTAPPGGTLDADLTVHNAGSTPVEGAVVMLEPEYGLSPAATFENCRYVSFDAATVHYPFVMMCRFDTVLAPGATYRLSTALPFAVRANTYAPTKRYTAVRWMTPTEWADLEPLQKRMLAHPGRVGTGGEIRLVETGSGVEATGADTTPDDNRSTLEVTVAGRQPTDLAAAARYETVSGAAPGRLRIGVHNRGPATLNFASAGEPSKAIRLSLPDGVSTVEVPDDCAPIVDGVPDWSRRGRDGAREYACQFPYVLPAGRSAQDWFEFAVRVADATTGARMRVTVSDTSLGPAVEGDPDPANDVLTVPVHPTATPSPTPSASASGSPSASPSASTSEGAGATPSPTAGGGGGGGGLALTGGRLGLVVGAGLALLAAGAVILMVVRRRTRFVG